MGIKCQYCYTGWGGSKHVGGILTGGKTGCGFCTGVFDSKAEHRQAVAFYKEFISLMEKRHSDLSAYISELKQKLAKLEEIKEFVHE